MKIAETAEMIVFEEMPCEMLAKIFSFLDEESLVACEKVCRRFKPIARHEYIKNYNNILKQNQLQSLESLPLTSKRKWIFYHMCVPYVMLGLSPTPGKVEPSGDVSLSTDIMYHFGHLRDIDNSNWKKRFLKAAILIRAIYSCKSYLKETESPSLNYISAAIQIPRVTTFAIDRNLKKLWLLTIFYTIFINTAHEHGFLIFDDNLQFMSVWDMGGALKISFALRGSQKVIKALQTCATCKLIQEIHFDDLQNEDFDLDITMEFRNSKYPLLFNEKL